MSHIQHAAIQLRGSVVFSVVDLVKAYNNIPMRAEDVPKTAVINPSALVEYVRTNLGPKNAGQTFMSFIHQVLRDLPFIFVYLDDILIFLENYDQHIAHLATVFQRFSENSLAINASKCHFA